MFSDLEVGLIVLVMVIVGVALGQVLQVRFNFVNPFKKK
jgi:Flp pilus assembly pilin Flp